MYIYIYVCIFVCMYVYIPALAVLHAVANVRGGDLRAVGGDEPVHVVFDFEVLLSVTHVVACAAA